MRLERVGDFEVLTSGDSDQGCKLALTERPDIILMDLEMIPAVDTITDETWRAPAEKYFKGEIIVGKDLMVV
jgi:DNA-binding NarL/FixJ family response regulator